MFLHLDTAQKTQLKNNNPFNCTIMLDQIYKGITKIYLKSAEIPIGFTEIHSPLNKLTINSTVYTVPEGTYTTAASLVTALNAIPGIPGVFSAPSTKFILTNGTTNTLTVTPGDVLSIIGFTNGQSGTAITATGSYNLYHNTFVSINLENVQNSSNETTKVGFKVPISISSQTITYYMDNTTNPQCLYITDFVNTDRFIVVVRDRYGNILNNNGIHWTFTLGIVQSDTFPVERVEETSENFMLKKLERLLEDAKPLQKPVKIPKFAIILAGILLVVFMLKKSTW